MSDVFEFAFCAVGPGKVDITSTTTCASIAHSSKQKEDVNADEAQRTGQSF